MTLDPVDHTLLQILQQDSRTSITELTKRLNLTKSPIYDRIRKLEQASVISKYVAVVDRSKVQSSMVVFCSVSLDSQKLKAIESFAQAIDAIPEVVECYLMGGANDFLLKVIVRDLEAYHQFSSGKLAALSNVSQIKSTFVLNEVKRSTVMPIS